MTLWTKYMRRNGGRAVALALLCALYLLARLPTISGAERQALARRFQFDRAALPRVPGPEVRGVRPVHPSLRHIAAWISTVGAAVALNDLDGDGLPNDLCYVDVRTDQVIVAPVPGTGQRYAPFALDAGPLFSRSTMAPMGCLPGDMNDDGRMDLLVYYWGRTPIAFLHQSADMNAAAYQPVEIPPALEIAPGGARWYTNAATFADLDGDGHPDLILGNYFEEGARILDASAGGGEHMQRSMSRALNTGRDRVMLWRQAPRDSVRFEDIPNALPEEAVHGWTLAVGAADLDGDLLPEIYFANDFGPDRLLHNCSTPGHLRFELLQGRRTFAAPKSKVLGFDSFKGMGVDFGDINGDGWPDLFVSNIAAPYALEESHFLWVSTGRVEQMRNGVAPYVDRSEDLGVSRSGWGWDARLADFDNDGVPEALQAVGFLRGGVNRWPELHEIAMGNDELLAKPSAWHHFIPGDDLSGHMHNPFYVRAADGRYYDVAAEMGMDESHVSRGIAIADVDGDGRLDYAVANQWEDSWFYHNRSPQAGEFLGLRIRRGNVPVIGATAAVYLPDGHRMVAQSDGGSGHSGKRSSDIHFGLGHIDSASLLRVEVRWRDASGVHAREFHLTPGWRTIDIGGVS
jgi:enediyne biosynthesis protein E4